MKKMQYAKKKLGMKNNNMKMYKMNNMKMQHAKIDMNSKRFAIFYMQFCYDIF